MSYKYTLPIGFVLKGGENDYVIEHVLGKGGFGVTYKVKATVLFKNIPFDLHFAVKEYFPNICSREADNATIKIPETMQEVIHNGLQDFINEGERLQRVCKLNPNIVNVNEVFQANGTAYYVLEYLEGGDLRKMVKNNGKPLTEQQMLDVMIPVGRAVQCLHDNRMLHLDIKPDNIVMRRNNKGNDEPVLIDFGIAVHFKSDGTPTSKTPSQGISPGYSPIEQYSPVKKFDPRIDVFAFTATCLYLLTGKDPIEATDMPQDFIKNELPQGICSNVIDAIECGMAMNKNDRVGTIDEFLSLLTADTVKSNNENSQQNSDNDSKNNDTKQINAPINTPLKPKTSPKKTDPKRTKKLLIILSIVLAIALIAGLVLLSKLYGNDAGSDSYTDSTFKVSDDNIKSSFEEIENADDEWEDFEAGLAAAEKSGKPVFLEFSGYGYVNCRRMESAVMDVDKVKNELSENFTHIRLMVDDKTELDKPITIKKDGKVVKKLRTVGDKWSYLQEVKFNSNSQPYYVVLNSKGELMSGPFVYKEDIDGFLDFLKRGKEKYEKQK